MKNIVAVLGDIMLDQYHFGEVKRLNPESPNPLLNITHTENRLGGASNVAANLAAMGCSTHLLGNVGDDIHGEKVRGLCKSSSIYLHEILTHQPTITKMRFVDNTYNHQLLRADFEKTVELSITQKESILTTLNELRPAYLVVADYNKGVLCEILIEGINKMDIKILLDTKSNKLHLFENIYLLKPNFKEFKEIIGKDIANTDVEIEKYGIELATRLGTNIVITRGKEGASLITTEGNYEHIVTEAKAVFDVSGAGDTFSAGVITGLMKGMNLHDAVKLGNKASGIAVSKVGTAIVTKEELFS